MTNELQAFLKILVLPLVILRASIKNQGASIKVKIEAREEQKLDFNVKVKSVKDLLSPNS